MVLTYKQQFNKKYGFKLDQNHSLQEISKLTGYKLDGLKIIISKGQGAFFSNRKAVRDTVKSPEQWAYARVYSAVMGGRSAVIDKDHLIKIK